MAMPGWKAKHSGFVFGSLIRLLACTISAGAMAVCRWVGGLHNWHYPARNGVRVSSGVVTAEMFFAVCRFVRLSYKWNGATSPSRVIRRYDRDGLDLAGSSAH